MILQCEIYLEFGSRWNISEFTVMAKRENITTQNCNKSILSEIMKIYNSYPFLALHGSYGCSGLPTVPYVYIKPRLPHFNTTCFSLRILPALVSSNLFDTFLWLWKCDGFSSQTGKFSRWRRVVSEFQVCPYIEKFHEEAYWPYNLSLCTISCEHYEGPIKQNYEEIWHL